MKIKNLIIKLLLVFNYLFFSACGVGQLGNRGYDDLIFTDLLKAKINSSKRLLKVNEEVKFFISDFNFRYENFYGMPKLVSYEWDINCDSIIDSTTENLEFNHVFSEEGVYDICVKLSYIVSNSKSKAIWNSTLRNIDLKIYVNNDFNPANLVLSSSEGFSFGPVLKGSSKTHNFILENIGDVSASNLFFNALGEAFLIINNTCSSILEAKASCSFSIKFLPNSELLSVQNKEFKITYNNALEDKEIINLINGIGIDPANIIIIGENDFGTHIIGGDPITETLIVKNIGDYKASNLAFSILNNSLNAFTITYNSCNTELDAFSECQLTIRFLTEIPNIFNSTFKALYNSGLRDNYIEHNIIAKSASPANLVITPNTPYLFQNTVVGNSSSEFFEIKNIGGVATNITITPPSGVFSKDETNTNCTNVLNPNNSCYYVVKFTPTSVNNFNSDFKVAYSATTKTHLLSGSGVNNSISLSISPSTYNFGAIAVNTSSFQIFSVYNNTGNIIENLNFFISPSNYFYIDSGPLTNKCELNASINNNNYCHIKINYIPTVIGNHNANLKVNYLYGTEAISTLSGEAVNNTSDIIISPNGNFGTVTIGSNYEIIFEVKNKSVNNTIITNISGPSNPFIFISSGSTCINGFTLQANQANFCTYKVKFEPSSTGSFINLFTINHTSGSSSHNLSGSSIANAFLEINPDSYDFGQTSTLAFKVFKLKNIGGVSANNISISLDGNNSYYLHTGQYSNKCTTTLNNGQECNIIVFYNPQNIGTHNTLLKIDYQENTARSLQSSITGNKLGSNNKEILSFKINGIDAEINPNNVIITLPYNTNLSSLSPVIVHNGISISPESNTFQNFLNTVIYTVKDENNNTKTYAVIVFTEANLTLTPNTYNYGTKALSSNTETTFSITNTGGSGATNIIPSITGVNSSFFNLKEGSYDNKCTSVLAKNHTCILKIIYNPQNPGSHTANLSIAYNQGPSISSSLSGTGQSLSNEAELLSFNINTPSACSVQGSINQAQKTVNVILPETSSCFSALNFESLILTPQLTLSSGASSSPASNSPNNFSSNSIYTITSQSATVTNTYTINIVLPIATINSFSILGAQGSINNNNNTITVNAPIACNNFVQAPSVEVAQGVTIFPSPSTLKNFKESVNYTVTGPNLSTRTYTVTVVPEEPAPGFKATYYLEHNNVYISFDMIYVPANIEFPIGYNDEGDDIVDEPFCIAETETTYIQWKTVKAWATSNSYNFTNQGRPGTFSGSDGASLTAENAYKPVTNINYQDMYVFTNALTEFVSSKLNYSLIPHYYNNSNIIRNSANPGLNAISDDATGFRLLKLNEWLFAARYRANDNTNTVNGYSSPYFTKGDSASGSPSKNDSSDYAVFLQTPNSNAHNVKTMLSNSLGLFDMSGNVSEFVYENNDEIIYGEIGGLYSIGGHLATSLNNIGIGIENNIVNLDDSKNIKAGFRLAMSSNFRSESFNLLGSFCVGTNTSTCKYNASGSSYNCQCVNNKWIIKENNTCSRSETGGTKSNRFWCETGKYCSNSSNLRCRNQQCYSNYECSINFNNKPICSNNVCVQCLNNNDCQANYTCQSNTCVYNNPPPPIPGTALNSSCTGSATKYDCYYPNDPSINNYACSCISGSWRIPECDSCNPNGLSYCAYSLSCLYNGGSDYKCMDFNSTCAQ